MERLGQQAFESYLWGAANLLRGLIDAGDYKQYVFPLLFFKRLSDVWDEEYRSALDDTGDASYARATADDRDAWRNDPWGRNTLGTPPQGRADYAFFQHILASLDPETGRCAILFHCAFADEPGFAAVASTADILANDGNLSIPRYVRRPADAPASAGSKGDLRQAWTDFEAGSAAFWREMDEVVEMLDAVVADGRSDG